MVQPAVDSISKKFHQVTLQNNILEQRVSQYSQLSKEKELSEARLKQTLKENRQLQQQVEELTQQIEESKFNVAQIEQLISQNNQMKEIITRQQEAEQENSQKLEKLLQIMFYLYKQGFDLEQIYRETFNDPQTQAPISKAIFSKQHYNSDDSSIFNPNRPAQDYDDEEDLDG